LQKSVDNKKASMVRYLQLKNTPQKTRQKKVFKTYKKVLTTKKLVW